MDNVVCSDCFCVVYRIGDKKIVDWLCIQKVCFNFAGQQNFISSLVGFKKMENQTMKFKLNVALILLVSIYPACYPACASANFFILDDAVEQKIEPPENTGNSVGLKGGLKGGKAVFRANTQSPQAQPTRQSGNYSPYRDEFGRRDVIKHLGRVPAVFGKPFKTDNARLSDFLLADVPESFAIFRTNDITMSDIVDGSENANWIEGLDYALKGTPYMATIDWNKREIELSKDEVVANAKADRDKKKAQAADEENAKKIAAAEQLRVKTWSAIPEDGLLSIVLERWCKKAGAGRCVQFINNSSHDVPIDSIAEFRGEFREAVDGLMTSVTQQVGRRFKWSLTSNNVLILSDDHVRD